VSKLISRAFSVLFGGIIAYIGASLLQLNYIGPIIKWREESGRVGSIDQSYEISQANWDVWALMITKWAVVLLGLFLGYLL
jgi:hypothetical protein